MLYGIGLLGVVTGTLASWHIDNFAGEEGHDAPATAAQVEELRVEIAALRRQLPGSDDQPPPHRASTG